MKLNKLLPLAFALLLPSMAQAQTVSTEEEDLPEGMKSNEIDSLLHDWAVRSYLQFDEDCQTTGENRTYEPEVYQSRLNRLPNVIEMTYNEVVQQYIDLYSARMRSSVAVMLGAGNFYNPIFEQALESYQVPLELKYLPVIESALNPGATSPVGAAGLWQFMIGSGKQYGLEITSLIDERRDPIKSSYAAARLLRDLHEIFDDWTLAIAAYNCGPGNVSKAIKRADGAKDYWTIYPYLPKETRGYVPAFIAANYIMNYYCDHNICPVNTTLPAATDTVMLSRNIRMEQISAACDITMDELKALNPQYRTSLIPGDSHLCTLRMPDDKIGRFIELEDSIFQSASTAKRVEEVEVKVETPTPEIDVLEADQARAKAKKEEHEREKAARLKAHSKDNKSKKGKGSRSASKSISVRQGETLSSIAKRNGTTVANLKKLNKLKGDNIRTGQSLRVK